MLVHREALYHFRCDHNPKHYWNVTDIEPIVGQKLYCPYCGKQSAIEEIQSHPLPPQGIDEQDLPTIEDMIGIWNDT